MGEEDASSSPSPERPVKKEPRDKEQEQMMKLIKRIDTIYRLTASMYMFSRRTSESHSANNKSSKLLKLAEADLGSDSTMPDGLVHKETTDVVQQLKFIESRLNDMAEVRLYLTMGIKPTDFSQGKVDPNTIKNPQKLQKCLDVFELEKQINKHNQAERQKRQLQEERDSLEMKKLKNEEKMRKIIAPGKAVEQESRPKHTLMKRTRKPLVKREIVDDLKQYSKAELDYLFYVEGLSPHTLKVNSKNYKEEIQIAQASMQEESRPESSDDSQLN
mmetsp:Transcript_15418/g.26062  ORF Transcript_15418/g.26062 Transcript_15418/m.26062 type:complete len:274 (-) Transcript_15418:11-832(-)